jgi:hypothetical protein
MIPIEEDGEQGFSLVSDGCLTCVLGFDAKGKPLHPQFIKQRSPSNASLPRGGPLYWVCPNCHGYYGEVQRERHKSARDAS